MPESESFLPMLMPLMWTAISLLVVLLLCMFWLMSRLSRLEDLLKRGSFAGQADDGHGGEPHQALETMRPAASSAPHPGSFEEFLEEDRSRMLLTKSEQAAAYRDWRKARGLNWK